MGTLLFLTVMGLVLTAPIVRPATIDGGRWHCLLCQSVGYGGVTGWDEHYMAWHYTPKKKGK